MANTNKVVVPGKKQALNQFKYEVAQELGLGAKLDNPETLTTKEAGSIGGAMVKKMIERAENNL